DINQTHYKLNKYHYSYHNIFILIVHNKKDLTQLDIKMYKYTCENINSFDKLEYLISQSLLVTILYALLRHLPLFPKMLSHNRHHQHQITFQHLQIVQRYHSTSPI